MMKRAKRIHRHMVSVKASAWTTERRWLRHRPPSPTK